MAQATTLLTSSVHEILDDPVVAAHANRLLQSLLQDAGAVKGAVEQAVDELRGGAAVDDPNAEDARQALEKFKQTREEAS